MPAEVNVAETIRVRRSECKRVQRRSPASRSAALGAILRAATNRHARLAGYEGLLNGVQ